MSTNRWRVGLAATLALTGVGLLFAEPALLAATVVPLGYVCYGLVSRLSGSPQLRATRTFDPAAATPGERVTVRLRVENTGDSVLPDVRVVDRVPGLAVVEGSTRTGTALAPGEAAAVEYTVLARRGDHEFDPPRVRLRSLAASTVWTTELPVETTTLTCQTPARDAVTEALLAQFGHTEDTRGEGTEFYATREYRRGDPMRRIDWRHVAKTGEFVTVQYRDEQTDRVAVIADARDPGRLPPAPNHPSGAVLAVDIAQRLLGALDRASVPAAGGVAGLDPGARLADPSGIAWAGADDQPSRLLGSVRGHLDGQPGRTTTPTGTGTPDEARVVTRPDGGLDATARALLDRVPTGAQVFLCTPAVDDWPVRFGQALAERGHELVVVSPTVTGGDDIGLRVARVERRQRLRLLDAVGETVDWTPGDGLGRRES